VDKQTNVVSVDINMSNVFIPSIRLPPDKVGVGVVKVIDSNAVLKDLRNELLQKEFSYFYENFNKLPVTEWDDAQEWLRS
jgi:hypothetical protein